MAPPRSSTASTRKRVASSSSSSSSSSSTRRMSKASSLPLSPPSPTHASVELLSDDDGQLVLPVRFQCPLCFDVLRAPIQLPCCRRHLCRECFERALELTSANCGFCRKRIVGLARTKKFHVDEALWTEIRRCCPFVAHADGASDCLLDIEFVDENAPPRPRGDTESACAVRAPEATRHDHDPATLTIAVDVSEPHTATPRRVSPADASSKMQRRLEAFFAGTVPSPDASRTVGSRPSSAGSVRSLRSTTSSSSASSTKSNARGRRRLAAAVGKKAAIEGTRGKPLLRSSSHSPKHRAPQAVQRTLLQLTIHSPTAGASAAKTATKSKKATSVATRSRRSWLCHHCTFENNCFDTRCSMCHQYPVHS